VTCYEDSSYDESFHTTSTLGSDSDNWFDDSQISIDTKPSTGSDAGVQQANAAKVLTKVKEESDTSSSLEENDVQENNIHMIEIDPTGPKTSPVIVIKIEQIDSDEYQDCKTSCKLPHICVNTASTNSEESNIEESVTSVCGYSNPTEQNDEDWHLA
jgi:hypothetical protein